MLIMKMLTCLQALTNVLSNVDNTVAKARLRVWQSYKHGYKINKFKNICRQPDCPVNRYSEQICLQIYNNKDNYVYIL